MISFHCDRNTCDTWTYNLPTMLRLTGQGDGEHHFCTLDCLMHWAAQHSEPTTVIT